MLSSVTFDLSGWPPRAINALLEAAKELEALVGSIENKPEGFGDRLQEMIDFRTGWFQDVEKFLEQHPNTPDYLREAFYNVRVYSKKPSYTLGVDVWVLPDLNGLDRMRRIGLDYPTFDKMILITRGSPHQCPLWGIGKVRGFELVALANEPPYIPPPPPPPPPEPDVEPKTDGVYTCAYCFGHGCNQCDGKGHFDQRRYGGRIYD